MSERVAPCVKHTHEELKNTTWCGRTVHSLVFSFQNIDHAAYQAKAGSRFSTCPSCRKKIVEALRDLSGFKVRA